MISGKFSKQQVPIPLYISSYRRRMIIQAMLGARGPEKDKAKRISQVQSQSDANFRIDIREKSERKRRLDRTAPHHRRKH